MPHRMTKEEAIERIVYLQRSIKASNDGVYVPDFCYRDAVMELMRLKRGLAQRKDKNG